MATKKIFDDHLLPSNASINLTIDIELSCTDPPAISNINSDSWDSSDDNCKHYKFSRLECYSTQSDYISDAVNILVYIDITVQNMGIQELIYAFEAFKSQFTSKYVRYLHQFGMFYCIYLQYFPQY